MVALGWINPSWKTGQLTGEARTGYSQGSLLNIAAPAGSEALRPIESSPSQRDHDGHFVLRADGISPAVVVEPGGMGGEQGVEMVVVESAMVGVEARNYTLQPCQ